MIRSVARAAGDAFSDRRGRDHVARRLRRALPPRCASPKHTDGSRPAPMSPSRTGRRLRRRYDRPRGRDPKLLAAFTRNSRRSRRTSCASRPAGSTPRSLGAPGQLPRRRDAVVGHGLRARFPEAQWVHAIRLAGNGSIQDGDRALPEGYWTWGAIIMSGIAYQPEGVVPPDQAPKSWEDVLDPKWKNSVSVKVSNSGLRT